MHVTNWAAQTDGESGDYAGNGKHAEYESQARPRSRRQASQTRQDEQYDRADQLEPAERRMQARFEYAPVGRKFGTESADVGNVKALVEQAENDQIRRRDHEQCKSNQD